MKTAEELNALKEEYNALNKMLAELTEEELTQVSGGWDVPHGPSWPVIKPGGEPELFWWVSDPLK